MLLICNHCGGINILARSLFTFLDRETRYQLTCLKHKGLCEVPIQTTGIQVLLFLFFHNFLILQFFIGQTFSDKQKRARLFPVRLRAILFQLS